MAYVDRSSNSRRTATAIAVAVIQAGLIYAVATGLAVKFIAPVPPAPSPKTYDVTPITPEKEKPKPPEGAQTKQDDRRDTVVETEKTLVDLPPTGPILDKSGSTGDLIGTSDVEVFKPLDPPPPATFKPRSPRPRNAPANWATPNDYPARDLREGNQGITGFRLSIGADGKVLDCQPIASSGFPNLDRTACDKVTRRARFDPATDSYGKPVAGTYENRIHWQIPK